MGCAIRSIRLARGLRTIGRRRSAALCGGREAAGWGGIRDQRAVAGGERAPITVTTANNKERIEINGIPTVLDQFRGTPYIQTDLRVSRPIKAGDQWSIMPFIEFFNLFNRNNPGANYVTNIATLPVPAAEAATGNVTEICTNASCTATAPISSPSQLRLAGGALGDFFGPGTTVGVPFAAQLGLRATF